MSVLLTVSRIGGLIRRLFSLSFFVPPAELRFITGSVVKCLMHRGLEALRPLDAPQPSPQELREIVTVRAAAVSVFACLVPFCLSFRLPCVGCCMLLVGCVAIRALTSRVPTV